jgi:hypothetical protein
MLDAEYGPTAANMIRNAGLMEHPLRLTVNADWDNQVNGEQQAQQLQQLWVRSRLQTACLEMYTVLHAGIVWDVVACSKQPATWV